MKIVIFIFAILCKVTFLHSTPVISSSSVTPKARDGLKRSQSAGNQFSASEEKAMLLQIAYPNLSIVPLIPASVQIESALSQEQKKKVLQRLAQLKTIFNDYQPIRDTFSWMAFMLQNPHLMETFLNASPTHKNGLPLANSSGTVQLQALQLLRLFETFVRSFSVPALLQSMAEVPSSTITQALAQLEKVYTILGQNPAYAFFLEGVTFGLKLQQSNPAPMKGSNPIGDLTGMLLAAKGGMIKTVGSAADVLFENAKDVNDMMQNYATLLKKVPVLGDAVDPAKTYFNSILDGVHMVIGDTAEAVGNALQSQGNQAMRRQGTLSSANKENLGVDNLMKL